MIKNIDFWPRITAENYLFSQSDIVISITDPGQKLANISLPCDILRLAYYDLPEAIGDIDNGLFTKEHAQKIINFLDIYHNKTQEQKNLIIHCQAGVSRSASVALFAHYYTKAYFPRLYNTSDGNILVANILSEVSNIDIIIPDPQIIKDNILLF